MFLGRLRTTDDMGVADSAEQIIEVLSEYSV